MGNKVVSEDDFELLKLFSECGDFHVFFPLVLELIARWGDRKFKFPSSSSHFHSLQIATATGDEHT